MEPITADATMASGGISKIAILVLAVIVLTVIVLLTRRRSGQTKGAAQRGRVCDSNCPYYGVDSNYQGFCKQNFNSPRERGAACNLDTGGAQKGSKCDSRCPFYGVDVNHRGFCKRDHNSYRDRGADCNL